MLDIGSARLNIWKTCLIGDRARSSRDRVLREFFESDGFGPPPPLQRQTTTRVSQNAMLNSSVGACCI